MVHFPSGVLSLICAYSGFTYDQKLKKMQKKLSIMVEILLNYGPNCGPNCDEWLCNYKYNCCYCNICEEWNDDSHCSITWFDDGPTIAKCENARKNFKLNKSYRC